MCSDYDISPTLYLHQMIYARSETVWWSPSNIYLCSLGEYLLRAKNLINWFSKVWDKNSKIPFDNPSYVMRAAVNLLSKNSITVESKWKHGPVKRIYKIIKTNLRDLIAATSLVILLILDSNCQFFGQCNIEICWKTSTNDRALLLYYIKFCASFQIHW